MPKRLTATTRAGQRLANLRQTAGFTQQELADEIGVSRRVIAYYEGETEYPPAALLPALAKTLKVSTDELLGLRPEKKSRHWDSRLQRRFRQLEKLDARKKRQIIQLLDTFIENAQLE